MASNPKQPERTYHVLGVPLRTGSLIPGSENDAQAYRDAQLIQRLEAAGCTVVDDGDLAIPSYLPHHTIPPIRNWPGPRIAWDAVDQHLSLLLEQPGQVPLLIGCDCSIVVGTVQALRRTSSDVHVLYVDGDYDDAPPDPTRCQSAAALAVWLLTNASPFWAGPPLSPAQVTVVGATTPAQSELTGLRMVPLAELRRLGAREAAQRILRGIRPEAAILLHVDVDVVRAQDLPAAYFPHQDGLSWPEAHELLAVLLGDPRVRLVELSEYASLRDLDRTSVARLADLLATALRR